MTAATTTADGGDDVADLPPSAAYVYHVLQLDGPLSRQELLAQLYLEERTLDRALARLRDGEYITQTRDPADTAQVVCRIDDSPAPTDTTPSESDPPEERPAWVARSDAADVPTCDICGNQVSLEFYRVWEVDGRLDGCRECRSRTQRFSNDPVIDPSGEEREPFGD